MSPEYYPELDNKDSLDVLLVGRGGREHALAWKLGQSERIGTLYVAPGNGGTEEENTVNVALGNNRDIVDFAITDGIDLVVIGPDDVLASGLSDDLREAGIATFGPSRRAAQIESFKPYAKLLMQKAGVPTAEFAVFSDPREAHDYIDRLTLPAVIKVGGLALGKGVRPCHDLSQAHQTIDAFMVQKIHGSAGDTIVIEEFLEGQEISLHALCAGENYHLFPSSQDHKQLYDGDKGPNTGGMGTVASVPWYSMNRVHQVGGMTVDPVLRAMSVQRVPYQGLLYPGIMLTEAGPKVLEYNARFGDPEAQVYMRLLESDLLELFVAAVNNRLDTVEARFSSKHAVCVVAASGGYGHIDDFQIGLPIYGLDQAHAYDDVVVFHAGTVRQEGDYYTAGGRVLGVTAVADTLPEAQDKAYAALESIYFEHMHYRTDIGKRPRPNYL